MTARIIFTDGSLVEARNWLDLERKLRRDSWNPKDKSKFRTEFAIRAEVWSGQGHRIRTNAKAREFFESLEAAGLLIMERTN
jgi:hypothetical protein